MAADLREDGEVREHENRLRRALEADLEARIDARRRRATDTLLPPDVYAQTVGKIAELKSLRADLPDLCAKIIHDEEDDDDQPQ